MYPVGRLVSSRNILTIYNALNIPAPDQPEADWLKARREGKTVKLTAWNPNQYYVPDVSGMTSRDAVALLENLGLKVSMTGSGRVKRQSLFAGTVINRKSPQSIHLQLN
jgi:cell division protein FtsI (penicillin-binding protein 3)